MNPFSVLFICVAAVISISVAASAYQNPSPQRERIAVAEAERAKILAKITAEAAAAHDASVKELLPVISACRLKMHAELKNESLDSAVKEHFINAACSSLK